MKHPIFTVLIENWKPMKESVQHLTTQSSRLFRITRMAHLILSALTHLTPLSWRHRRCLQCLGLCGKCGHMRFHGHCSRYVFLPFQICGNREAQERPDLSQWLYDELQTNPQECYVKSNKQCQCVHGNGRPSGLITEMNLFRCFYCLQCYHVKKEGKMSQPWGELWFY